MMLPTWLHCATLAGAVVALPLYQRAGALPRPSAPLPFSFTEIAARAGITHATVFGDRTHNRYLLETTGSGVALIDYDNDGWMDIFFVNGTTFTMAPGDPAPSAHLYRNLRNGRFEDVTAAAGLQQTGWGQAACVGDYDANGHDDLYVTFWGQNRLFENRAGTFVDVTARAQLTTPRRWGAGCAFFDLDRDGDLDLFVANYIDFDPATTPTPESGLCRYKGVAVACGPPGLKGGRHVLYRNEGNGRFTDISTPSGITATTSTYGMGASTLDFDDDGWTDLYVASDSSPSALFRNNRNGTMTDVGVSAGCAFSQDGKPQAGMGVAIADLDRSGTMDVFKTNFAGDTSTLYLNDGRGLCDDRTFAGGVGINTRYLGWGVGAMDMDRDGWPDLFLVNGHVYPEVSQLQGDMPYAQSKIVYRNMGRGRFEDVTARLGAPVTTPRPGRGAAFGDLDNDGDIDVVVNNMHTTPDVYRLDTTPDAGHWLTLALRGGRANRHAIGARVRVEAGDTAWVDEVRGGGSYYAQNDFRVHVGLGQRTRIDRVVVRWPTGAEEMWTDVMVDRIRTLHQGEGAPVPSARMGRRLPAAAVVGRGSDGPGDLTGGVRPRR